MRAFILAGGKGTRLRPLTLNTPKPIVPLANRPFLLYQIDMLKSAGITDVTLSLNYQPEKIEQRLGDGSQFGVNLYYATEPSPLGTAGAIRYAADGSTGDIVVLNGDILTTIDLARMIEEHRTNDAAATLALIEVEDPSRYGLIETLVDGTVKRFIEKPKPGDTSVDPSIRTINAGIYVLKSDAIMSQPYNENRSFEYDVFPDLLTAGEPVHGYLMQNDHWSDIGQPASYLTANLDIISGKIDGTKPDRSSKFDAASQSNIDTNSVIGEGSVVRSGARITNSVLGNGVHVEEKAVIENSVIWSNTRVAANAVIRNAIIGRSCHIGRSVRIGEGAVLGDKTQLNDHSII